MKMEEVKKLFRGIRSTKKEMELRLAFLEDVKKMKMDTADIEDSIMRQYDRLKQKLDLADRMLEVLEPEERTVLTARYYAGIRWEYIESKTLYSCSQSQRIHDRALRKLTAFSESETEKRPAPIVTETSMLLQSQ